MEKPTRIGIGMILLFMLICSILPMNAIADSVIDATYNWSSKSVRIEESGYVIVAITNTYDELIEVTFVGLYFDWQDDNEYFESNDCSSDDPLYIEPGDSETVRINFEVDEDVVLGSHSYYFYFEYGLYNSYLNPMENWIGFKNESQQSGTKYDFTVLEEDRDEDGVGDSEDAFPDNPNESVDTDGDGVGDNQDDFPSDPLEHADSDGDGIGDNTDKFPNDSGETKDTDRDGIGDNGDKFPNDPAASKDTDGDGYPDGWNTGKTEKDSTSGLKLDAYPQDATKWRKEDSPSFEPIDVALVLAISITVAWIRHKLRY